MLTRMPASRLPDVGTTIFTVMSAKARQHNAINLSQGFPDFDVPDALRSAVSLHLNNGHNQYAPMAGVLSLREQLALKVERSFGARFDPDEEITVVPGATEAIFCAIMATVRADDEVILLDPSYDCYEPSVRLAGGRAVRVNLDQLSFRPDWSAIRAAVNDRTRMIVINSPHNPTGTTWSSDDMDELERLVVDTGIVVLSDEVYEHLVYDDVRHQSVLARPAIAANAFAVFSFGKTFHATGWKTGYCVAPKRLTAELRRIHQFVTFVAVTPIQYALADFIADNPGYTDTLSDFYQAKRDFFLTEMKDSGFKPIHCSGTYFQLMDYSMISNKPDTDMANELVSQHGVAAIPISVFSARPDPDRRLLRFCFAKQEATLAQAAQLLKRL